MTYLDDRENDKKLEITQNIYDNVHGFIGITDLENQIIASPFFQRLRRIRQLSLLDYVFPGATHNRFSHSLGVMHIADSMVVQLQKDGHLKGKRELIRMAALLHDIGHYPLSHLVEEVVQKDARIKTEDLGTKYDYIQDNEVHKLNCDLHERRNESNDFAHHERMAGIVIYNTPLYDILSENDTFKTFSKYDIRTISQVIAGSYQDKGPESLIIHSELDADRFDYLLRDSKNTGVTYGIFDFNQIIRNLKYIEDEKIFAVNQKAIKAVEHYLMCRYFFYTTVIYHKAAIGFWIAAEKIYEGLLERGLAKSYFDLLDTFKDKDKSCEYLDYDDSYFFNLIKDYYNDKLPKVDGDFKISDEFLKELISKLLNRSPLKLALEESRMIDKKTRSKPQIQSWLKKDVLSTNKVENSWYIPYTISESPTKISPYLSFEVLNGHSSRHAKDRLNESMHLAEDIDQSIKVYTEDKRTHKITTDYLVNIENSIIHVLGNYKLNIERIYTKNDEYGTVIRKKYEEGKL